VVNAATNQRVAGRSHIARIWTRNGIVSNRISPRHELVQDFELFSHEYFALGWDALAEARN
jgi:hypothetical protein